MTETYKSYRIKVTVPIAAFMHGLRMSCPYIFTQALSGPVFACISVVSVVDWRYRRRT